MVEIRNSAYLSSLLIFSAAPHLYTVGSAYNIHVYSGYWSHAPKRSVIPQYRCAGYNGYLLCGHYKRIALYCSYRAHILKGNNEHIFSTFFFMSTKIDGRRIFLPSISMWMLREERCEEKWRDEISAHKIQGESLFYGVLFRAPRGRRHCVIWPSFGGQSSVG